MVLSQNSLGQRYRRPMDPVTLGTGWASYPRLASDSKRGGGRLPRMGCRQRAFHRWNSSKANMKAIQVKQTGGPEVMELVDLPVPQPKSNEAVVKIRAAGVNYIDVYNREGRYKAPLPLVLGQEAAGVVIAVGPDVHTVAVGDPVAYTMTLGSYAEYAAVPGERLGKIAAGGGEPNGA